MASPSSDECRKTAWLRVPEFKQAQTVVGGQESDHVVIPQRMEAPDFRLSFPVAKA
jgi:hypothetical protein